MYITDNIFGHGSLFDDSDFGNDKVFFSCCACMSIYAEVLSWANQYSNQVVKDPENADIIVVLSCQVTDLAVLHDIRMMEKYMEDYPGKRYFIGGCLARRFDICLPLGVARLDHVREDLTVIQHKSLVHFEKPFWVPRFEESDNPLTPGNLFRNMYPLRISVGCERKCSYCTIRTTRGAPYEIDTRYLWKEMSMNEDILLIADSPSVMQLKHMITLALNAEKKISIRNVEPHVTKEILPDLITLAQAGLLDIYHSPIQSHRPEALKDMNRDAKITTGVISDLQLLRKYGVKLATNVIIDYKNFLNPDWGILKEKFDYVSWNPYWDGCWNRGLAEVRFERYIGRNI